MSPASPEWATGTQGREESPLLLHARWTGCYPPGGGARARLMQKQARGQEHPAKMSVELAERIWQAGADYGWWDETAMMACPMGGEGTETLVFRAHGNPVYAIELVPTYFERLAENHRQLQALETGEYWEAWEADATEPWPRPGAGIDVVVFSPTYEGAIRQGDEGPYATHKKGGKTQEADRLRIEGYGKVAGQIGDLQGEQWRRAMQDIYRRAYEVVRPGGHMVTVTKDRRKHNHRYPVKEYTIADAQAVGWGLIAWFEAVGAARSLFARTWNNRHRAAGRGDLVIDSEDVLVFRKPHIVHENYNA